jgi:PAS domain S-box-containing protein
VRFEVFDKLNVGVFNSNSTWSLYQDGSGILRIGTNGSGLISYDPVKHTFSAITTKQGLPNSTIRTLCQTRDGDLWIGTEGGLVLLSNGGLTVFTTTQGLVSNRVRYLYEDRDGGLWIGTQRGLNRRDPADGSFTTYTEKDGLAFNTVNSIYQDSEGVLWIGTNRGLNRMENGKISRFILMKHKTDPSIWPIVEDRDRNLWIGTYGEGLYRLRRTNKAEADRAYDISVITTGGGLNDDIIWSLYEDREGNLWIGSDNGGLNRLRDGKLTTYTRRHGLSDNRVYSICEDRRGNLWIGTNEGGLNRMTGEKGEETFTVYTTPQEVPDNRVWSIREGRDGIMWISTESGGLDRMEYNDRDGAVSFTRYTTKDGLSNDIITDIWNGRDSLWLATYGGGVNRFKNGKFTAFTTKEGMSNNYILCLLEDRRGVLWIGTEGGGLNRLETGKDGPKITVYKKKDGLTGGYIMSLYEDERGSLWIGTYSGLNRLKDGKFSHVTMKDGLFNDIAYVILDDGLGYFWMTCNKGIFRTNKKELNDFLDGKTDTIQSTSYDDKDGMVSRECWGTTQPAGWKSRDGRLWVPTTKGLVRIDPGHIKINEEPPPVAIEAVIADERPVPLYSPGGKKPELPPGLERFEIHYTAMSFKVPERVRFMCKLEGFDKEWRSMETRRTAYYTKLSPGDYTFRVKACSDDGVWNETGASLSFYLKPYFYQTGWFRVLAGFALLALAFTGVRRRVGSLTRRKAELERLVKQRTSELEQTNKELEKLSIVARETDNAILIMDARGDLEWTNEGAERMYGYTCEQLIEEKGKNITDISSHTEIKRLLSEFLAKPEPLRYQSLYKTRTGKSIWTQITWTPVLNPQGELTKIVAIASDITRIKESEDRIKEQNRAIREQNEQILEQSEELRLAIEIARRKQEAADSANMAKSEFLARMSHELRTPLNGIIGFAEMLADSGLNPEQTDYTRTISRSGETLAMLLNDLLDFSRVEEGELQMKPVDFEPRLVFCEVCDIVRPRLKDRPVSIRCLTGEHVPVYVRGDRKRFRQVLLNLVGNAAKFTETGSIDMYMQVEKEERDRVRLHTTIKDTGIGIPGDELETIFAAFQQMDGSDTRRYDGAGLGLSISRRIARLMGGDVTVESTPGQGSTFHFTAWMKISGKKAEKGTGPEKALECQAPPLNGTPDTGETPRHSLPAHILVAEDNPVNRKLVNYMLSKAGYRLTLVEDGRQALDTYSAEPGHFDLIFMDIQMPRMTGLEATREIRKRETPPAHIPIIAMTAQAMKGDREKCINAGMDDYIAKPIKQDVVLSVIKKWAAPSPTPAN